MDDEWSTACQWLWKQRKNAPPDADIWDLRFHWKNEERRIWNDINNLKYRLSPMWVYRRVSGEKLVQWCSRDALVLKCAALHADNKSPVHARCEHRRGHGGVMKSVSWLHEALATGKYKFVLRTDIKGYYRHIRKEQLRKQITHNITDGRVRYLAGQYLYYCIDDGGEIHTPETGMPGGCALSPLMGGSLLYHIDAEFNSKEDIYYARYMDGFILLAGTRWRLRQSVARFNEFPDRGGFK